MERIYAAVDRAALCAATYYKSVMKIDVRSFLSDSVAPAMLLKKCSEQIGGSRKKCIAVGIVYFLIYVFFAHSVGKQHFFHSGIWKPRGKN